MKHFITALFSLFVMLAAVAQANDEGPGSGPWQFGKPDDYGFDPIKLKQAADAVGEIGGRQGLVIVRDGVIVYEDYWTNAYHQATPVWRNVSFSAAKSFASALIGVAVENGLLSIEELASKYHSPDESGLRPGTTIEHLLTMSSGGTLVIKPSTRRPGRKTDNQPRGEGIDYLRVIKPEVGTPEGYGTTLAPGELFFYDGEPADHLANVIAGSTNMRSRAYAWQALLEPMGIENFNYQPEGIDSQDNTRMSGSVELSVRDLARLGQLWLNEGRWDGKQLVNAEFVRQSITPSVTNPDYGYLWWLNTTKQRIPEAPSNLYYASGAFGQTAYVLPEHNIVVATMGFTPDRPPGITRAIWNAIAPGLPLKD